MNEKGRPQRRPRKEKKMTKKEMMKDIDRMMMVALEAAFEEKEFRFSFDVDKGTCLGILLTASALGLVNNDEFININRIISFMSMTKPEGESIWTA